MTMILQMVEGNKNLIGIGTNFVKNAQKQGNKVLYAILEKGVDKTRREGYYSIRSSYK